MTIQIKCKNAAWQAITKFSVEAQKRFWASLRRPLTCLALSIIYFIYEIKIVFSRFTLNFL